MRKLFVIAAIGASLLGVTGAQAQSQYRHNPANDYVALVPQQSAGDQVGYDVPADQQVMGLSVPNGFRTQDSRLDRF